MQLDIITAITRRAKAKYDADYAWLELYADESWILVVLERLSIKKEVVGHGDKFDELPALLNFLK